MKEHRWAHSVYLFPYHLWCTSHPKTPQHKNQGFYSRRPLWTFKKYMQSKHNSPRPSWKWRRLVILPWASAPSQEELQSSRGAGLKAKISHCWERKNRNSQLVTGLSISFSDSSISLCPNYLWKIRPRYTSYLWWTRDLCPIFQTPGLCFKRALSLKIKKFIASKFRDLLYRERSWYLRKLLP